MGKVRNQLYQRMVVKFGTGLVTGGSNHLNSDIMSGLVAQVAQLHEQGRELIVVSSGAIASGRHKLGLSRKVRGIPYKQVLAAVGQSRLMHFYDNLFSHYGITVAQALLAKFLFGFHSSQRLFHGTDWRRWRHHGQAGSHDGDYAGDKWAL